VLYNECCRTQGIAARFVSGYHMGDAMVDENYLHAWSEAYIPGGGWRGFDPTLGLAVADGHLALAASARPALAARVEGTFRGTGARSEMSVQLAIQTS
jgi:transglutaminase-like putative cysteine protease